MFLFITASSLSDIEKFGAGDRSRTGVASLGSWSMTVLLHPHKLALFYNIYGLKNFSSPFIPYPGKSFKLVLVKIKVLFHIWVDNYRYSAEPFFTKYAAFLDPPPHKAAEDRKGLGDGEGKNFDADVSAFSREKKFFSSPLFPSMSGTARK